LDAAEERNSLSYLPGKAQYTYHDTAYRTARPNRRPIGEQQVGCPASKPNPNKPTGKFYCLFSRKQHCQKAQKNQINYHPNNTPDTHPVQPHICE